MRARCSFHGDGAQEALDEPFNAFPSWFLRIECDRCGKVRMVNEVHMKRGANMLIHDILHRMRHDGCGGRPEKAELLTGIGWAPLQCIYGLRTRRPQFPERA